MKTNGAGDTGHRELENRAIEALPHEIRQIIFDAPINVGAWGIYQHFHRMRISGASEIAAYATDLRVKIDNMMRGGDSYSTRAFWANHPQMQSDYKWPNWQMKPKRNRRRPNTRIAVLYKDA